MILTDKTKIVEIIAILLLIILVFYLLNKIIGFNIFNVIPTIDENITYGMFFVTGLLCKYVWCHKFINSD